VTATFDGYTYSGSLPALVALTIGELTDLYANSPFQAGITQAQYDVWVESAHFVRHVFDSLANSPFS